MDDAPSPVLNQKFDYDDMIYSVNSPGICAQKDMCTYLAE